MCFIERKGNGLRKTYHFYWFLDKKPKDNIVLNFQFSAPVDLGFFLPLAKKSHQSCKKKKREREREKKKKKQLPLLSVSFKTSDMLFTSIVT